MMTWTDHIPSKSHTILLIGANRTL